MGEVRQWGLIGPGSIGSELVQQLSQDHVADRFGLSTNPSFVLHSSGLIMPENSDITGEPSTLSDIDNFPEVTFIAMPSSIEGEVEGETAMHYLRTILERGKMAVTAEKGAMANNFEELRDLSGNFARLGVNATVGGGTRILEIAEAFTRDIDNITQIHLVLNGTLAAIMSYIAPLQGSGMSLGQAAQQAVKLGYAEPGGDAAYEVFRSEAEGDIPKKIAIFFNKLGLGKEVLDWKDLQFKLEDEDIARAVAEANIRRFIVSLYNTSHLEKTIINPNGDIVGGRTADIERWKIIYGFQHVNRNPLFHDLANLTGPGNGMVIGLGPDEKDGVYNFTGPGAGINPTVNTMIDDFDVLQKKLTN